MALDQILMTRQLFHLSRDRFLFTYELFYLSSDQILMTLEVLDLSYDRILFTCDRILMTKKTIQKYPSEKEEVTQSQALDR